MPELITFGETMISFVPKVPGALRYECEYHMRIAGAESNLAIGVAKLGRKVGWISRLGRDEFGFFVLKAIRGEGVDTSEVILTEEHKTGLMFKQMGVGETKVFYYRENSAASHFSEHDLKETWFQEAKIIHLTGITPVLSKECKQAVLTAIRMAQMYGTKISFDPNIRKKLWNEVDYAPLLREITLASHIVLLGLEEAEVLFGTKKPDEIFDLLLKQGKAEYIAIKNGADGAWVCDKYMRTQIEPHPCKCVEPIGAGDAFNAGFLSGILENQDITTCGRMGAIAGAMATQSVGDIEGYPDIIQMKAELAGTQVVYR